MQVDVTKISCSAMHHLQFLLPSEPFFLFFVFLPFQSFWAFSKLYMCFGFVSVCFAAYNSIFVCFTLLYALWDWSIQEHLLDTLCTFIIVCFSKKYQDRNLLLDLHPQQCIISIWKYFDVFLKLFLLLILMGAHKDAWSLCLEDSVPVVLLG